MIFFTSDHHFGHKNIIRLCRRPFSSVEEMDDEMIRRWNETVGPKDTVYHLGDFSFRRLGDFPKLIAQLNGDIRFVVYPPHHDKFWLRRYKPGRPLYSLSGIPATPLPVLKVIYTMDYSPDDEHPQAIVMCHYPFEVWEQQQFGSWHVHGHTHGTIRPNGKRMDVSVDVTDFRPVSMPQLAQAMLTCEKRSCLGG